MPTQISENTMEGRDVVYWTHPVFTKAGTVDTREMVDFLTRQVPNNYYNKDMHNTWNPGEEFEVQFVDYQGKETITYICILEIHGHKDNYSIVCSSCEPESTVKHITKSRSEEIAELISGNGS